MPQNSARGRPRTHTREMADGDRKRPLANTQGEGVKVAEVGRYVAEMCGDLTLMASSARLLMLTFLLSMARQEAERVSRTGSGPKQPVAS